MIHPQLRSSPESALHATMLVYLFTDAVLEPAAAGDLLHHAVESTFNRISIDGDTSTNDTVLLLASGATGVAIRGHNHDTARTVARTSAQAASPLRSNKSACLWRSKSSKTEKAFSTWSSSTSEARSRMQMHCASPAPLPIHLWSRRHGQDAIRTGAASSQRSDMRAWPSIPRKINISYGPHPVCEQGSLSPRYDEAAAHQYLTQRDFTIHVDLGLGSGACRFWTTDLTTEYIRINADYST